MARSLFYSSNNSFNMDSQSEKSPGSQMESVECLKQSSPSLRGERPILSHRPREVTSWNAQKASKIHVGNSLSGIHFLNPFGSGPVLAQIAVRSPSTCL